MYSDKMLLQDIHESCINILDFTNEYTFESFAKDIKTQAAVIRMFEIIGEASKNLSKDFKLLHHAVPWKLIIAMRNLLAHAYRGVNMMDVWTTIKEDVPPLIEYITPLIA